MKISIITPCLNRAAFISDAVESVLAQDFEDFEHIIMDGGSVDATLSILSKYPHLKVFSEADRGMYDAINKGFKKSGGEIIGLLNSDDVYEASVFSSVESEFNLHPNADVITGKASYFQDDDGKKIILKTFPPVSMQNFEYALMRGVPIINAWFFRRGVFEKIGPFDQDFFIAADRDFQARCLVKKIRLEPVNRFFYHYRHHQGSMTVTSDQGRKQKYLLENLRLANKYASMDLGNVKLNKRFESWVDFIIFELIISGIRRRKIKESLEMLASAIKEKPLRIVAFLREFLAASWRFLYGFFSKQTFTKPS